MGKVVRINFHKKLKTASLTSGISMSKLLEIAWEFYEKSDEFKKRIKGE